MKIFIRDIPPTTERKALSTFINKAMRGPWYKGFAATGNLDECEIIRVKDLEKGTVEYHGIVDVTPSKIAWELISRLNGALFMGRAVQVRKWFNRTGSSDRRLPLAAGAQHGYERRKYRDRRRDVEVSNLTGMKVTAVKGFHRTH